MNLKLYLAVWVTFDVNPYSKQAFFIHHPNNIDHTNTHRNDFQIENWFLNLENKYYSWVFHQADNYIQ